MALKTVLITGCSNGGIGAGTAVAFASTKKYHVFATARSIAKMSDLASLPNTTLLEIDATSSDSIVGAAKVVAEKTGGKLDVLVNNAGQLLVGPLLDTDVQKARQLFDVNFWGVVEVTNAFARMVVAAKGTIALTGSVSGDLNMPFSGYYAATKAAAMTYSETLRLELAPFGVKVLTMATGGVESKVGLDLPDQYSMPDDSLYKPLEEYLLERLRNRGGFSRWPTMKYAEKFLKLVQAGRSGKMYLGDGAGPVKWILAIAPTWVIDRLVSAGMNLEMLKK